LRIAIPIAIGLIGVPPTANDLSFETY